MTTSFKKAKVPNMKKVPHKVKAGICLARIWEVFLLAGNGRCDCPTNGVKGASTLVFDADESFVTIEMSMIADLYCESEKSLIFNRRRNFQDARIVGVPRASGLLVLDLFSVLHFLILVISSDRNCLAGGHRSALFSATDSTTCYCGTP